MLHLFNVFREHDGKENCAQVLKEELHRMLGIEYVNDEHDCNAWHRFPYVDSSKIPMLVDHEKKA